MLTIYFIIFCSAMCIELSTKCNTRNLIKKTGLALIMVGALVHMAGKTNLLIEIGCLCMLVSEIFKAFTASMDRRKNDGLPRKRKILS